MTSLKTRIRSKREALAIGSRLEVRDRSALAFVLLLATFLLAFAIKSSPQISHIDELQHFDYLQKISQGEFVRRGDLLGEESMREMACRGIDIGADEYRIIYGQSKDTLPSCDARVLDHEDFPERGVQTVYVHAPLYYVVAGLLARAVRAITPIGSLFTAARAVGILWLGLAVLLIWRLLSVFAVPVKWKVLLSVIFVSSPGVLGREANVNPDATALAAGAGLLLATVLWERRSVGWWAPVLAVAVSIALKETNVIGVGVVVIYLLIRNVEAFRHRHREQARRILGMVAAMLLTGGLVGTGWLVTVEQTARAPLDSIPQMQRLHADEISARDVVGQAGSNLFLLNPRLRPSFPVPPEVAITEGMTNWFLIGSAIAAACLARPGSRTQLLAGASLGVIILAGPFYVLTNFFAAGIFVEIPSRYALSAAPALIPGAAFVLKRDFMELLCVGLAIMQVAFVTVALVG